MRLLRGEDIGEVSREVRVAPPELERWRRVFLDGGQQGLKGKNRAGGELMRTRAKLGEMTMRVELQSELLENKGVRGRAAETLAALRRVSPATNRTYPLTMCASRGGSLVRACMRCARQSARPRGLMPELWESGARRRN